MSSLDAPGTALLLSQEENWTLTCLGSQRWVLEAWPWHLLAPDWVFLNFFEVIG